MFYLCDLSGFSSILLQSMLIEVHKALISSKRKHLFLQEYMYRISSNPLYYQHAIQLTKQDFP